MTVPLGEGTNNPADGNQFSVIKLKNWPFETLTESYSRVDSIAYAKGIGVGMPGPLADYEAHYLRDDETLQTLPMMAIVLNQGPMWTQDPRSGIDWRKTVHAEESIAIHRPLPNAETLVASYRVNEVYDKGEGKGALMHESRELALQDGTPMVTVNIATFLRGNGGFGGNSDAPKPIKLPDDRPADRVIEILTPDSGNTTFQLGSEFISAVKNDSGTPQAPMLRGVCSFGLAGRAVLALACNHQPERLQWLGLRYIAPVFADETLRTELWDLGEGEAAFRVSSVERDTIVMSNGLVKFSGL